MAKETLGMTLARARRAKGITQAVAGTLLGVSSDTVARWERDEVRPRFDRLVTIGKAYGFPMSELVEAYSRSVTAGRPPEPEPRMKTADRVSVLEDQVVLLGIQVGELLEEVTALSQRVTALERRPPGRSGRGSGSEAPPAPQSS